jgi:curved DNA-binding protein CbpA
MAAPLVPRDDLYARLEVSTDASPEAIELAWRALLKRHHPDVAGGDEAAALERAKRINVAHDWLSSPELRARYDAERLGPTALPPGRARSPGYRPRGARAAGPPTGSVRTGASRTTHRTARTDLFRGTPAERLARFLDRVARLSPDELDRLATAEPPPIAFLATIRRFLAPEARASFAAAEAALTARVPRERWAQVGIREGLLGVAAELVLSDFLDDTLAEPFRGRARDRLLRAWEASVDQSRYGPNGAEVAALRDRASRMTPSEIAAFLRASQGIAADARPWPERLDRDEDEALRISALLAARDAAGALPVVFPAGTVPPASAARSRRLLGRLGHVVALRPFFPAASYRELVAPFTAATRSDGASDPRPGVRRTG